MQKEVRKNKSACEEYEIKNEGAHLPEEITGVYFTIFSISIIRLIIYLRCRGVIEPCR
tara:strand:+ start:800 stop:973 length:174 start_codon:yes stop_codon:yes gene_type:complete